MGSRRERQVVPLGCHVNDEKNLPLVDAQVDVLPASILRNKQARTRSLRSYYRRIHLLHLPENQAEHRTKLPASEFRRFSRQIQTDRRRNSHETPPELSKAQIKQARPELARSLAGDLVPRELWNISETYGAGLRAS